MDDWSKRATLLKPDSVYRVRHDTKPQGKNSFKMGECVKFLSCGHSRYDGCYVYAFATLSGVKKSFWFNDDSPSSRLLETFELIKA